MTAFDPITKPAPLLVWPISVLVALAIVGGATFVYEDTGLERRFRRALQVASKGAGGAPLIVVVGDSRIVEGFEDPVILRSAVVAQLGRSRRAGVVTLGAGAIDIRNYDRLWADVLKARPALVLIEMGLLVPQDAQLPVRARKNTVAMVRELFGRSTSIYARQRAFCDPDTAQKKLAYRRWIAGRMREPLLPYGFERFLDAAAAAHLRVRFLRLPRKPSVQAWVGAKFPHFEREIHRRFSRWPWLDPIDGPVLDELKYCDSVHLGPAGRKAMTPWFGVTVAQALEVPPP